MGRAWIIKRAEVTFGDCVGTGSDAVVFAGSLHGKWRVAIKKTKVRSSLKNKELRFVMRIRFERLCMFLGCGKMDDGTMFMVSELWISMFAICL